MSTRKIFAGAAIAMMIFPALAFAAPSIFPTGYWGPLLSCTGDYANVGAQNGGPTTTCQSLCDLITTAVNVLYFAMSVALFIIAPILIAVGGVMIMTAGASPENLNKGKSTLTATVVGIAIILCSYLVVSTFISLVLPSVSQYLGGFGQATCQTPTS